MSLINVENLNWLVSEGIDKEIEDYGKIIEFSPKGIDTLKEKSKIELSTVDRSICEKQLNPIIADYELLLSKVSEMLVSGTMKLEVIGSKAKEEDKVYLNKLMNEILEKTTERKF